MGNNGYCETCRLFQEAFEGNRKDGFYRIITRSGVEINPDRFMHAVGNEAEFTCTYGNNSEEVTLRSLRPCESNYLK